MGHIKYYLIRKKYEILSKTVCCNNYLVTFCKIGLNCPKRYLRNLLELGLLKNTGTNTILTAQDDSPPYLSRLYLRYILRISSQTNHFTFVLN